MVGWVDSKEQTARCSSRAGGHAFGRAVCQGLGARNSCLARADGVMMRTGVAYDGVRGRGCYMRSGNVPRRGWAGGQAEDGAET